MGIASQTSRAWAEGPDARLLLILSSERSGSTLLRYMLGAHSRIVSPAELFILRYPDYETWRREKPVAMESLLELFALLGTAPTAEAIDAACRGRSASEVYEWIFRALPAGRILIDKTPAYANDARHLERARPLRPFYVWLIRHPLGVVDSQVRLKEKLRLRKAARAGLVRRLRTRAGRLKRRLMGGDERIGRAREAKWVEQNRNIARFLGQIPADRQCTLHFEAMVRDPERALQQVCAAMGLAAEPGMAQLGERPPEMNIHLGDPNFHQHRGVDEATADDWALRYREDWLRADTRRLMAELGVGAAPEPAPSRRA